jgi:uncharacterized protein with PIN domain
MKHEITGCQIVNVSRDSARCRNCGADVTVIDNIAYAGVDYNTPAYRLEKNACRECGKHFFLRHDIIARDGHINKSVFAGDCNDPSYTWESLLTKEQLRRVQRHLAVCKSCQKTLNEAILEDAVVGAFIQRVSDIQKTNMNTH